MKMKMAQHPPRLESLSPELGDFEDSLHKRDTAFPTSEAVRNFHVVERTWKLVFPS